MPDSLDQRALPAAEHEHIAGKWIPAEALLHLQSQPAHATAHISVAGGNPDSDPRWDWDHCRASSVAVTRDVGAIASMTTRTPAENSTVIATGAEGGSGGTSAGGSASATTAGTNANARLAASAWRRHL